MCGIAGIWHLDGSPLAQEKLRAFTDSLSHRGPDGGGLQVYGKTLGLGHRRLSVIDPGSGAAQPMQSRDGRYSITFNGEIYNFLELRRELSEQGFSFVTDSDTEVILAAYQRWGPDCQLRFNGMWALAIYHHHDQRLFLSRDRFGVKPLHYVYRPGKLLAFASETIAFAHLEGFQRELNPTALARAISQHSSLEAYGYTIYRELYQLLPGHCAHFSPERPFQQVRWWDTLAHTRAAPEPYQQQVERFAELFSSACQLRLRADVPLASALSGGLDSSAVYCTVHRLMQQASLERVPDNWQSAYVATFPGSRVDERHYAEQVVASVGGPAHYLSPDHHRLAADLESTTRLFDGLSGTPLNCLTGVYRAMREQGVVVSLDGHGADELMFGYRQAVWQAAERARQRGQSELAADYTQIYLDMMFPQERAQAEQLVPAAPPSRLRGQLSALKRRVKGLLGPPALPEVAPHPWLLRHRWERLPYLTPGFQKEQSRPVQDPVNYINFHYAELPYNLRDFDRGAMQHGVEIRMPFLDYRLVSYLFSLDESSKLGGGHTKRILRDAMAGVLPESIRNRRLKIGLGSPLQDWFNGPLAEYLCDEVASQTFRQHAFLDGPSLQKLVVERCRQRRWSDQDCHLFWPILNAHILFKRSSG